MAKINAFVKNIKMKSNSSKLLIDNYFGLLSSLSNESKLKIIAKLSDSIINEPTKKENFVEKFFGAFKSSKSAEEIISEIKESRKFNRTIEAF